MVSTLEASLIVFAVAGLPLVTMRLGIGLGIFVYGLDPFLVCLLAITSNLLVILPVWSVFPYLERACRRSARLSLLLDRVFARTRKETAKRQALEEAGIFVIVGLTGVPFPLPGSGLYTGLLAQYIFGLPMRKALPWHAAGIVVACVALTLQAVLGDAALRQFFHL